MKDKQKRGPKPERLQIDGDWENAAKKALSDDKTAEKGPDDGKKEEKSG